MHIRTPNKYSAVLLLTALIGFKSTAAGQMDGPADTAASDIVYIFGSRSFADSVVLYDPGAPGRGTGDEPDLRFQNPKKALGPPDHKENSQEGFVSLGKGGSLILKFTDNLLIDEPGPDIMLYEVAPDTESVNVWISPDGVTFMSVGKASRASPLIDIGRAAEIGTAYPYIKLRDDFLTGEQTGAALGADIDAVGAIHTVLPVIISADTLFYENTSDLKNHAAASLSDAIEMIHLYPEARISINVYSDSQGADTYMEILTQVRAGKIRDYFLDKGQIKNMDVRAFGWGRKKPVASNETEAGRKKNRRVEILISTP